MTKYNDITYPEFKGKVLASLDYIQGDVKEIKVELKTKACKKDVNDLKKELSNIKLVSKITVVIGATLTAIGAILGFRKV